MSGTGRTGFFVIFDDLVSFGLLIGGLRWIPVLSGRFRSASRGRNRQVVTAVHQIDNALLLVEIDDVLFGSGQFLFLLLDEFLAISLQFSLVLLANLTRLAEVNDAFAFCKEIKGV